MRRYGLLLTLALAGASALAALPPPGSPGAVADARYCGEPARDTNGVIKRSTAAIRRFVEVFPCPATLLPTRSCKKWAINHQLPLASGGCDAPHNMVWLPTSIKSCDRADCVDRWERTYNATPRQRVELP